jgi:DNA-binding transcriptional LysR family regulator
MEAIAIHDTFNGIQEFVEAVEAGGFSAAATRMNLSRSAIGKAIGRLERRLDVRLFYRTTRTQSLTEEGQAFYERCRRALDEIQWGEAMLESGRREVAGRLRISMPVLFGRRCVAPLLMELARLHPHLELDLAFSDRVVDLIEDGFDLAVRNGQLKDSAGLTVRTLAHQPMVVCAAPAYLEACGTPQTLAQLAGHDCVTYMRAGDIRTWMFPQESGPPIEFRPETRLRFDDLEVIADYAAAGMGLAWLPCWLVRPQVRSGALVELLTDLPRLTFDAHAVWPQTPHLPLKMRVAIDLLAARLPRLMT